MADETLSVIVPNYNHGQYIAQALESILHQSFRPRELIVVDDGSTDRSLAILEELAQRHPIVRVIRNERNMGYHYTFNRGMEYASGEFLFSLSADDVLLPGFFESCMALFVRYPQAGLCASLFGVMDEQGKDLEVLPPSGLPVTASYIPPASALALLRQHGLWAYKWIFNPIYRRSVFLEAGGHIPELGSFSDSFIDQVIALRYGACLIPEPLGKWRYVKSGYSSRTRENLELWVAVFRHAAGLMRTTYADLFPSDWVDDWESEYLYREGLDRITAAQQGQLATLSQLLPPPGLMDRAFFSGLRFSLGAERLLMRLYLYLRLRRKYLWPTLGNLAKRSLAPRWGGQATALDPLTDQDPGGEASGVEPR